MPIGILELLKWSGLVIAPVMSAAFVFTNLDHILYKFGKMRKGGRGVRLFYSSPNGKIFSRYVEIGNEHSDKIIEFIGKYFIYDRSMVRTLPKGLGKVSGEPFLWYTFDNLNPLDISSIKDKDKFEDTFKAIKDIKQAIKDGKIKDGKDLSLYMPAEIDMNYNIKTPEAFYTVMRTKVFKDFVTANNDSILGKRGGMMILIIIIMAGIYLLAKNQGWI